MATLAGTLFTALVVVSASLTAIVLAVRHVGMLAFLDLAATSRAIAFSIGHGTDSFGSGCLRLKEQAVLPV
jgi:hypothetical protein